VPIGKVGVGVTMLLVGPWFQSDVPLAEKHVHSKKTLRSNQEQSVHSYTDCASDALVSSNLSGLPLLMQPESIMLSNFYSASAVESYSP
jgi:hypothetical protein